MSDIAIKVEALSKLYQLGTFGTGTLSRDIKRWWALSRGKEDPFSKVGQVNDRSRKAESDFVWALKDINFEVKKGEVLGIIGRNGAGKSTLLKVLSKITSPTTGRISVDGRIASLLEVGTGFHPEMTGRENIFLNGAILGMRKWEIKKKFDEIVDFAGVEAYIDTPVKRYSSGMYVRLAFAVAAFLEPEILIVDEVLAVGDAEFQKKCLGRMKDVSVNDGRTVLFVSHNLAAVQNLCSRALLLKDGKFQNLGSSNQIINEYINNQNRRNYFKKYDNYLSEVSVKQFGKAIIINVEYDSPIDLDIPHFGFVIYNNSGNPLFGSNPTLAAADIKKSKYKKGSIKIEIYAPRLLDGEYFISIWFGDSKRNLLEDLECISFEVSGMADARNYNSSLIGNVFPDTNWSFS